MTGNGTLGTPKKPDRSHFMAFCIGALVGVPVGMVWSWFDYGAFELGYMSNHVIGAALICGLLAMGIIALRRWLRRNPV